MSQALARAEEQARRKRQRLQLLLWMLEDWFFKEDSQGMQIREIRIINKTDVSGDVMIVVKANVEGRPYVGFHSGPDPEAALVGALDRVRNNALKWREDAPYEP